MNEEMQKKLNQILSLMIDGLEKAGEITSKELPSLIEDYLNMYLIDAIPVATVFAAVTILLSIIFWTKTVNKWVKTDPDASPAYLLSMGLAVCLLFILDYAVKDFKEIIKIKAAPKAYLIEKLRK